MSYDLFHFQAFYGAFEKRTSILGALNQAKMSLQFDSTFASTFYWAGFECIGFDNQLHLIEMKSAMLDQSIDKIEAEFLNQPSKDKVWFQKRCLTRNSWLNLCSAFVCKIVLETQNYANYLNCTFLHIRRCSPPQ